MPKSDHVFTVSLLLGTLFVVTGTLVNIGAALITDRAVGLMRGKAGDWVEKWIPGVILLGLGTKLAFTKK